LTFAAVILDPDEIRNIINCLARHPCPRLAFPRLRQYH
jgi:hypothetical protein